MKNRIKPVDHKIRHGWPLNRSDSLGTVGEIERFVEVVGQNPDHFTKAKVTIAR